MFEPTCIFKGAKHCFNPKDISVDVRIYLKPCYGRATGTFADTSSLGVLVFWSWVNNIRSNNKACRPEQSAAKCLNYYSILCNVSLYARLSSLAMSFPSWQSKMNNERLTAVAWHSRIKSQCSLPSTTFGRYLASYTNLYGYLDNKSA